MWLRERLLFFSSFRKRFHDTGAIMPSSRVLAKAMVAGLGTSEGPRKILEVGPGTGSFTWEIIPLLGPNDELHLCEINEDLLSFLRRKIQQNPEFASYQKQIIYHSCPIQDLDSNLSFHHIVSGLPFNNFKPELVEQILDSYKRRLLPGGTARIFEYLAVRHAKMPFADPQERVRLKRISSIMKEICGQYAIFKRIIWLNFPPGIAWCLCFDGAAQ